MSYHNAYTCTPIISSGHTCQGMRYLHFLLQEASMPRVTLGISAGRIDHVKGKTSAIKLYKAIKESDFMAGNAKQRSEIISHPLAATQIKFGEDSKSAFIKARATQTRSNSADGYEVVETVVEVTYEMGYNIVYGGRFLKNGHIHNWGSTQDPIMLAAPTIMYDDRDGPSVIRVSGHRVIESQLSTDVDINRFQRVVTASMGNTLEENLPIMGRTGKVYKIFTKVNRILLARLLFSYKYYFARRSPGAKVIG